MRVDAHHHLWHYTAAEFGWIGDEAAALRRDYLPDEFEQALTSSGIDAAVVVQARCSLDETQWLLRCAAQSGRIRKVVGWAPLSSSSLSAHLDAFAANPHLAGFREIMQNQPAGSFLLPAFHDGIRQLTTRGFTYDILIRAHQLEEVTRFVDLHPRQLFVLDHAAKPAIAEGRLQPWRVQLQQLAQRPHVFCKLSGLVTEARWHNWSELDLEPYLDACLEAFGPARCMAGSDWPVCLLASSYHRWWQVLHGWTSRLSGSEQDHILGLTAASFYGIPNFGHMAPGVNQ